MTQVSYRPSRREFGRFAALCALIPCGIPVVSHAGAAPVQEVLKLALSEVELPMRPATLRLVHFTQDQDSAGLLEVTAVVRLDWAPGWRQRGVTVRGSRVEDVVADLVEQVCCQLIPAHASRHG